MLTTGQATKDAANRGHFYSGGVVPIRKGLAFGGGPYSPASEAGSTELGIPTGTQGHSAFLGLAAGGRAHYDGGGYAGPYGDLSSILATQENMYQPNQTRNRNIPNQTQNHQLAVASGSPPPRPSGASNAQTSIGLGKDVYQLGNKGYNMYQNSQNFTPTFDTSIDPSTIPTNLPAPTFDAQPTGLSGASTPAAAANAPAAGRSWR